VRLSAATEQVCVSAATIFAFMNELAIAIQWQATSGFAGSVLVPAIRQSQFL
jgi:hypothetical protein